MGFIPADAGALADFVTLHPVFSIAPVVLLGGLGWWMIRRSRG